LFLGAQPRHPSQGVVALADPDFAGCPLVTRTVHGQNNRIRRGDTWGGLGVFRRSATT